MPRPSTAAGAAVKAADGGQQIYGLTPIRIGDLALGAGIAIYVIRTPLAAVPNRTVLLDPKTIVLGVVSLVVGMISVSVAFFVAKPCSMVTVSESA